RRRRLNPSRRHIGRHRDIAVHVGDPARTEGFDVKPAGADRVLTPSLQTLKDAVPEQPPAMLINGVPPQDEPGLLQGEPPRLTPGQLQLSAAPPEDIPPDRRIRQQPPAITRRLPRRADTHRLPPGTNPRDRRRLGKPFPIPTDNVVVLLAGACLSASFTRHDASGRSPPPAPTTTGTRPAGHPRRAT